MHLLVCTLGTLLAMVGHFPRRPWLWVPHVVGLGVMLALAYGVGGEPLRWSGVALLVLLALVAQVAGRVGALRTRVESGIDTAAMVVLVAVMPVVGHHAHHHMDMPATGHGSLLVALATVAGWAGARAWAAYRFSGDARGLGRLDLAGAALMVSGMTLMVVS